MTVDFVREHTHRADPSTSIEAATQVTTVGTHRRALLAAFDKAGPQGLIADEATTSAGIPAYPGRQRITDLLQDGELRDTGSVRPGLTGRNQRVLCRA
jgi:hypothetical protein